VNNPRSSSLSLPGRRSDLGVVPANAGTHTPRPLLLQKVSNAGILAYRTRRMGPGFRRDDVWMVLREDGK
jgi:hypothetical protein